MAVKHSSVRNAGRQPAGTHHDPADGLKQTLADEAYEEIKRRIVMIELEPGSQFREADLTAGLGLGKTPVREALLRLSIEGFVQVQSRAGYRVAPVTLKSARDLCQLRALLEGEAAFRAASARGGATDELQQIERSQRRSGDDEHAELVNNFKTVAAWLTSEATFHAALARTSGNALLATTQEGLFPRFERLVYLASALGHEWSSLAHGHGALIASIARGDAENARSAVVDEVRDIEAQIIQALLASESLYTTNVDPTAGPGQRTFYLNVPVDRT